MPIGRKVRKHEVEDLVEIARYNNVQYIDNVHVGEDAPIFCVNGIGLELGTMLRRALLTHLALEYHSHYSKLDVSNTRIPQLVFNKLVRGIKSIQLKC